jgi:hypothetical protein
VTLRRCGTGAALRTLCACAALLPLLSSCSLFHHHELGSCTQKPFQGSTVGGQGLSVPPGMSAPDTRSGVKIPALNEQEVLRPAGAPCLTDPPSFAAGEAAALPGRGTLGAPGAQPVPIPVPNTPVPTAPVPAKTPPK